MAVRFAGVSTEIDKVRKAVAELEKQAVEETRRAAIVVQDAFFSFTPVWEGETIRNYAWGINGAPPSGVKQEIGSGDPGPTGRMPLGVEPRRAANEDAVMSELRSLLTFNRLVNLSLTNNAPIWDLVDNGSAPTSERARNPGGVSKNAVAAARSVLAHWR